jgi:hypothetical protein
VDRPQTSYAWNDGTALAYQVFGSSGPDLVLAPGSVTHLEILWEEPRVQRFLTRLAGFSRLIVMDPRGLGLWDRLTEVPTLNERVADLLPCSTPRRVNARRCSGMPIPVPHASLRPYLIPIG